MVTSTEVSMSRYMQRLSNTSVGNYEILQWGYTYTPRCGDGAPLCPRNYFTGASLNCAVSWTWLLSDYKIVVLNVVIIAQNMLA